MYLKKLMIGAIALSTATLLVASPRGMMNGQRGMSGGMGSGMMMYSSCSPYKGIELSDEQKDSLTQLRSELRESMQSLKTTYTNPMVAATQNGAFNTDAFIAASNASTTARVSLKADYKKLMYNVLTQEQQKTFIANIKEISENSTCERSHRRF